MNRYLICVISFIMTVLVLKILFESNTIIHKFIAILGITMYYRGIFREYKKYSNHFRLVKFHNLNLTNLYNIIIKEAGKSL